MKYIDLETWKRKGHFEFFHRMDYPHYNICMNLDVSNFVQFSRRNNLSFYYAMVFAGTSALNQIENFRYRIRDGKVVLHDKVHPSFTDMDKAGTDDLFKFVTPELGDNIFDFERRAKETSENQQEYFEFEKLAGRDDLVYITCIPWISFTHISHTISFNKDDSVPRISWGKFFTQDNKILLPFSVQVNHALIDCYHVGKYINQLQTFLDQIT
ncbi:chloramphenicol acetyltransferase [Maribellus sp. YY47]|uniref:chloramphenicol acetyltransferase n=1 Tax=Maribellus sp. YY47 TaxID=2929486 RepID=UPI002001AC60|nr:chloramphenicol acetyltransferase [Maribellus sp. YY47]MCK3684328.1 chloramphenicol acetyltransferase [Maribellus sp. YY47]